MTEYNRPFMEKAEKPNVDSIRNALGNTFEYFEDMLETTIGFHQDLQD